MNKNEIIREFKSYTLGPAHRILLTLKVHCVRIRGNLLPEMGHIFQNILGFLK